MKLGLDLYKQPYLQRISYIPVIIRGAFRTLPDIYNVACCYK